MTRLIAGLGNPGGQYEQTRHNAGFLVIDALSKKTGVPLQKVKSLYYLSGSFGNDVRLARPDVYMNESGKAISRLLSDLTVSPTHCLVVVDDVNLPFGVVRLRDSGSAGGHHGLESIIEQLNTQEFPRLRIGVGLPLHGVKDLTHHVLGHFQPDERERLPDTIEEAAKICLEWAQS